MCSILESQPHVLVGKISYKNIGLWLTFTKGLLLEPDIADGGITVKFERRHDTLPDYFEIDAAPIVSERFVGQLKSLPVNNYQLLPVVVEFPDGRITGHYLLNIVGRVSCIDVDASECKMYKSSIMRMNNLVLNEDVNDMDMFRSHEYPLAIFISDKVKESLECSPLTGMLIKPASGWNDKHRF